MAENVNVDVTECHVLSIEMTLKAQIVAEEGETQHFKCFSMFDLSLIGYMITIISGFVFEESFHISVHQNRSV